MNSLSKTPPIGDVRPFGRSLDFSAPPRRFSPRLDSVLAIQDGFGLPMADLASVLRVCRESFISWIAQSGGPASPGAANASPPAESDAALDHRIRQLAFWASWWKRYGNGAILAVSRNPLPGGRSMFDLLCEEPLDESAMARGLAVLAASHGHGYGAHVGADDDFGMDPGSPARMDGIDAALRASLQANLRRATPQWTSGVPERHLAAAERARRKLDLATAGNAGPS